MRERKWWSSNALVIKLFLFFLDITLIISPFVSQGTPVNIIVGSHVWVEDPTLAWIDGEVVSIKNNEVHVQTSNGKKVPFTFSSHAFCIRSTSSSCYDKFKLCWFFCTWHFLRNIGVILKRKFTDLFQYFCILLDSRCRLDLSDKVDSEFHRT